jgi:hypothetical protein
MRTTRRSFAKSLSVAVGLIGVDAGAVETPPPDPQAELVRSEFGKFLSRDEVEKIRKDFAESAPFLQKFRDVKLQNGDEPDFTFVALSKR